MEGRDVGTIGGKSLKQGLISAKDLPMTILHILNYTLYTQLYSTYSIILHILNYTQ